MSDDTEPEGRLISFPPPGGVLDRPPDLADPGRLFPAPDIPPESPEETTMELPVTPAAPDPLNSLRSEGIPFADPESDTSGELGEDGEGEYVQPRSLADRLGDWLEYRIEMGRARLESDAPFREAEIARKVALLESQTARETGLMDAQNKLRQARLKAGADRAGARGKADASAAGFGSDKGRGKSPGSGGGAGRSSGSGRGGGTTGPGGSPGRGSGGASGRGPGGGNSPKSAGKGPDRSGGGRASGPKGHESSGGSKGRQGGAGGLGSGRGNAGRGSAGGSGTGRDRGAQRDGGKTPASRPAAERARGRQERAAARQSARQQRAAARQAAGLSDRSRDRDQDREAGQAARDRSERRADKNRRRQEKTERKEQQRKRQQTARERAERTGFGEALAEEAQRRWDKRRPGTDAGSTETSGGEAKERKERKEEKDGKPETGDGGARTEEKKSEPGDNSRSDVPPDGASEPQQPGGPEFDQPEDDGRGWTWTDVGWRRRTSHSTPDGDPASPFGPDRTPPTPEWADGRPNRPADTEPESSTDIWDAVIVDDEGDPFRSYAARRPGLPRAPRQRPAYRTTEIKRPGTSRPAESTAAAAGDDTVPSPATASTPPTTEEHHVAHTPAPRTPSASGPLPAQHQTDITFEQYLIEAVNLAVAAGADKEEAIELANGLEKVADALRDMAADLTAGHAIDTRVTALIADLADAADQMKKDATHCATESGMACEAAVTVAGAVGLIYGQDQQAMQDAGLTHTSAAAHH
ncbi:ATP/GTP-binding protein [Streptomyces rishiriensis]|uniref:ATP/GTP-binding protein n=1 Tax=Streptomyces rishiriensis TaxID=68264 RepID=A0ABU0NFN2_STRRH|nr:ATP/GTP-binding protein [Streptomyces rishiriensis]MDQ0577912.1 hypothetical protein [Streptomyces rishiriensis]